MKEVSRRRSSAGAILLAMGMVMLFVNGAGAASVEPVLFEHTNVFCTAPTENQTGLGLDRVAKFGDGAGEHPLVDGESTGSGITVVLDVGGGTVESWDSGDILIGAVIVKGGDDSNVYFYEGGATSDTDLVTPLNNGGNRPGISHVDFCAAPPPPPPVVLGSGSVSVTTGACTFEDGLSNTPVEVVIAPDGAADVTLTGDGFSQTFTGSGGTATLTPGEYSWSATANEGFELVAPTSGTVTADQCLFVLPRGPLARTGVASTGIAIIGAGSLVLGWAIKWGEQRLNHA